MSDALKAENRRNRSLMQRFAAAFTAGDVDAVVACLAPQFEWHLPDGTVCKGRNAVRAALEQRLNAPSAPEFTNIAFRYHGDTVIQTYDVAVKGTGRTRRRTRGLDVYRISKGGLIARKDAYWKAFD